MAGTKCRWCTSEMHERTTDRSSLTQTCINELTVKGFLQYYCIVYRMEEQKSSWCSALARLCATRCLCSCTFTIHLQLSASFHSCSCEMFIVSSPLSLTKTQLQETITRKITKSRGHHLTLQQLAARDYGLICSLGGSHDNQFIILSLESGCLAGLPAADAQTDLQCDIIMLLPSAHGFKGVVYDSGEVADI